MDVQEYRAASREQWQGSADGWQRHADHVDKNAAMATEWMLDAAQVRPGAIVLELACGPAGVGIAAAERLGGEGKVIVSDFAEPMVEVARERAAAAGASNLEFRVLDGEELDLPEEAVDVVLCRFGFMLMADPDAAFAEARRVLRPGGRLALAVWSRPEANPWLRLPIQAIMEEVGAPPPEPTAPGVFALADQARLRSLLEKAGLSDVRVEEVPGANRFASFDEYWQTTTDLAAPLRGLLANMDEDARRRVVEHVREGSAPFIGNGGEVDFPATALGAAGRR